MRSATLRTCREISDDSRDLAVRAAARTCDSRARLRCTASKPRSPESRCRKAKGSDGRSRSFVNDQPVSVQALKSLGAALVEIHGQHDERALVDALQSGVIAGAGLDVVAVEPMLANNPLLTAANCIFTPHIAWASLAARKRLMNIVAGNIAAFLAGKPVDCFN